ncbi:MAG TPA: hypothetical protein VJX92_03380 [Methylomirabilota bacterium]|nr:hypothetical protein [Methylomirabilota bacterium]
MLSTLRGTLVSLAVLALVGPGVGPVAAADRSDVDAATKQVERGAAQMGEGKVLQGAGETAKGIGNTVVAGAKYTGQKLEEAGEAAGPAAKTAWDRTKEGAVYFGSAVREFFGNLFR